MSRVRIWADLSDRKLQAFGEEAKRRGVSVESLLEEMVDRLLREEEERQEDPNFPIVPT